MAHDEFSGPCPHCGVLGHWPAYEAAELAAGRCPWSGLGLVDTPLVTGQAARMCEVCDCFGYPLEART